MLEWLAQANTQTMSAKPTAHHKQSNNQTIKDMSEGLYSMEAKDYDKTLDLTKIKPYGDTMNDGKSRRWASRTPWWCTRRS